MNSPNNNPKNKNTLRITAGDGNGVRVFRRSRAGSTRKLASRPRRETFNVVIQDRHSSLAGRDLGPDAVDRFRAPQLDLEACERFAAERGWNVVDRVSFLNYTGTELDRLEPYIEQMEADPPTVDALVFLSWDRFSRSLVEGPLMVERVRAAGGDLKFVDNPDLDIYSDESQPLIAIVNVLAAMPALKARTATKRHIRDRVTNGRVPVAIWCYRKLEHGKDILLPDGTTKRVPAGTLEAIPELLPFGGAVYDMLYGGVPPAEVVRWLNENELQPLGARVRQLDGTVVAKPTPQWDTDALRRWVRNPINKGYVQAGDHIARGPHTPVTTEDVWDHVNFHVYGSRTGSTANPGLCSGILRCQYCRGTLTLHRWADGRPKRYSCTSKYCRAHANVEARLIDPLVEIELRSKLEQRRAELDMLPTSPPTADPLAQLRAEAEDAEAEMRRIHGLIRLAREHPARYNAQCSAAERAANGARRAYNSALRTQRLQAEAHNALDDWDGLTTRQKNTLIRCTWPIIWVRTCEYMDSSGCLRRNVHDLRGRLWFIPEGEQGMFVLPRKGQGWEAEAHEPVPWPDGARTLSTEERRGLRDRKRRLSPGTFVTDGAAPADVERWRAARAHFVEHGRTDAEVYDAWQTHGYIGGSHELGMSTSYMRDRVKGIRIARGELPDGTVVERLARKNYDPAKVSNEDVLAAFELHGGDIPRASRELGMPSGTFRERLLRAQAATDPEARVRHQRSVQRKLELQRRRRARNKRA
jgi:Resolvase, N terminal domain